MTLKRSGKHTQKNEGSRRRGQHGRHSMGHDPRLTFYSKAFADTPQPKSGSRIAANISLGHKSF